MVKEGKTLCLFSSKGGVGKTSIALNLAGTFSRLNKKVLLLDFDLSSGAIAAMLDKEFTKTIYNFIDDYQNNRYHNISDYAIKYNNNISFVAAPKDPRQLSQISSSSIEVTLAKAKAEYDYIIIDTNHVLSEFNVTLLDKVDEVLLVVSNDLVDLKNTKNIIKIFKDINKMNYKVLLNNSLSLYKKYFSNYDVKNIIKRSIDYELSSNFYLKTYDSYVVDGRIITLDSKMPKIYPKDNKAFLAICKDMEDLND